MKLKYTGWGHGRGSEFSIEGAVSRQINESHRDGTVEALAERLENATDMIGRLVSVLAKNMRDEQILEILGGNFEVEEEE